MLESAPTTAKEVKGCVRVHSREPGVICIESKMNFRGNLSLPSHEGERDWVREAERNKTLEVEAR